MSATVYFVAIAWLPAAALGVTLLVERHRRRGDGTGWGGPGWRS